MVNVQVVDLSCFQAVIQLAAGLNLGVTAFKNLRMPAEHAYERAVSHIDHEIQNFVKYTDINNMIRRHGEGCISEEDLNFLKSSYYSLQFSISNIERVKKDFVRSAEWWNNRDEYYQSIGILFSALSIYELFQSSHLPIIVEFDNIDQANSINHAALTITALGCSFLYIPIAWSVISGLYCRFKIWRLCRKLRRVEDRLYRLA